MGVLAAALAVSIIAAVVLLVRMRALARERNATRAALDVAHSHDPLTKLPNRMRLTRRLDEVLGGGGSGALLILDLEGVGAINDALGHDAGDGVLVEIAQRLREVVRADDDVARLSGGEFVVLLRMDPDADVLAIAERALERARVSRDTPQGRLDVTVRVGMVQWHAPLAGEARPTAAELLRSAERAMSLTS